MGKNKESELHLKEMVKYFLKKYGMNINTEDEETTEEDSNTMLHRTELNGK